MRRSLHRRAQELRIDCIVGQAQFTTTRRRRFLDRFRGVRFDGRLRLRVSRERDDRRKTDEAQHTNLRRSDSCSNHPRRAGAFTIRIENYERNRKMNAEKKRARITIRMIPITFSTEFPKARLSSR